MSLAWVRETLDAAGVSYRERHHGDTFTAQELARREHVSGHCVAKVVVAKADGRTLLLILPASRKVRLPDLKELCGATEVRLATEKEMQLQFGDCEVGAVPPLRQGDGVEYWMDATMRTDGNILFQAGNHHDAIEMSYRDWFAMVKPRVEAFTVPADRVEFEASDGDRLASMR